MVELKMSFVSENSSSVSLPCIYFMSLPSINLDQESSVAEWVRSLNFSALNHSIISPL